MIGNRLGKEIHEQGQETKQNTQSNQAPATSNALVTDTIERDGMTSTDRTHAKPDAQDNPQQANNHCGLDSSTDIEFHRLEIQKL